MFLESIRKIYNKEILIAIKWSFIGQILTRLINLCATIFMARAMLTEVYGTYTYIVGTLIFFSNLVGLSIRTTSTRNIAFLLKSNYESFLRYTKLTLNIGVILGLIGVVFSFLLILLNKNTEIVEYFGVEVLLFAGLAIFSEIFYGIIMGVLGGVTKFKLINHLTIASNLFKFLISYTFYIYWGLKMALIGWVSVSILFAFVSFWIMLYSIKDVFNIKTKIKYKECKQEFSMFLKITLPISIEASMLLFTTWFIQTVFLGYGDLGKHELGILNVANQWKGIALYVPAILINLLQPFFSRSEGMNQEDDTKLLFKNTRNIVLIISLVITACMWFLSGWIISLFGSAYVESELVLKILIIPTLAVGICNLYRELYISKGKVWAIAFNNLIFTLLVIGFFFLFKQNHTLSISYSYSIVLGELSLLMFYLFSFRKFNFFK